MLINQGRVEALGSPEELFLNPDLSLVKHAHSGLLLKVTSLVYDEKYALLRGWLDGQEVFLTAHNIEGQQQVQVKVESKDVVIATALLNHCSLQNCLRVTISSIKPLLKGSVLLTLSTGKQKILAKVTCKSLYELDLQVNQSIFAYIKTLSILDDLN
ncbi:TOBE domain-containing protein [Psychromonas sp. MME2]|uniref:TOBE domain-containing protein n=1 Tax=unclassified Psychromonas TaxID=2614957 RepID=UPI00339CDD3E